MAIKAINSSDNRPKQGNITSNKASNNHQQSFTGSFNPVVALMDGIDKGGFAASFIVKDGLGMVAPRIYEGLNRNRERDENGKRKGPLNWEFARREGIREILSGPSAFLIPMGIMGIIKKTSLNEYMAVLRDNQLRKYTDKLKEFSELRGLPLDELDKSGVFYVGNPAEVLIPEYLEQVDSFGLISPTNRMPIFHDR